MISQYVNLVVYRSFAELRSEGTRTYAGYLWWILEPLLSLAVYYIAFKYIFHRATENFVIFLFTGIVIYRFFAGTVTRSAGSIIAGHGLMQLVYIHKSVFPVSVVLVNLIKFLATMFIVLVLVWLSGISPNISYIALPLLIILQIVLTTGVSMICAAISPFFPDFQLILSTLLNLLIFLSGVFYRVDTLPEKFQMLIRLNPIAAIIEQYREILLYGHWPSIWILVPAIFESLAVLILGWWFMRKFNWYFPKIS